MVYGRKVGGRTLDFEASGALLGASLVLRDRQTDSWWSIMSSKAIGGPLDGTALGELPVGTKTTWGAWRAAHPGTLVLSVGGVEDVASNPYDEYFASGRTFRGLRAEDGRLPAKEPIFAFRVGGEAWAVPHREIRGAVVVPVPGEARRLLLHRAPRASIYASTDAFWVEPSRLGAPARPEARWSEARAGEEGYVPVAGFDTFWYTWVAVNGGSGILAEVDREGPHTPR